MRCVIFLLAAALAPLEGQNLPDGPGRGIAEKLCSNCHGLAVIVGLRHTKAEWDTTVDDMVARGMKCSDEEYETVLNYLVRYFGRVDINQATSKEIQEIVDLSAAEADAIVQYRAQNGNFKNMSDLYKVPKIDANKLDERKNRIIFK